MIDSNAEFPRVLEREDLDTSPPEIDGTKIVLQRHGKFERSFDSKNSGSLTAEGVSDSYSIGKDFFDKLFNAVPEDQRKGVDILVVASDTRYESGGYRSMETAEQVIKAVNDEIEQRRLDPSQLLNNSGNFRGDTGPRPMKKLQEPNMFVSSPDFVKFLADKYGDRNSDFWIAFEQDKEKEAREEMKAEGPDDLADRLKFSTSVFARYANIYHKSHPDRRLIIWAVTHSDTISPFVKREILSAGKEVPLGVDYSAGFAINIDREGNRNSIIAGNKYQLHSS